MERKKRRRNPFPCLSLFINDKPTSHGNIAIKHAHVSFTPRSPSDPLDLGLFVADANTHSKHTNRIEMNNKKQIWWPTKTPDAMRCIKWTTYGTVSAAATSTLLVIVICEHRRIIIIFDRFVTEAHSTQERTQWNYNLHAFSVVRLSVSAVSAVDMAFVVPHQRRRRRHRRGSTLLFIII